LKVQSKFSIRKRLLSFRFAYYGLVRLWKEEHNSRIHLIALILVLILGFYFKINPNEWIAILIVCALVFLAEIFNSAIENLADFIEPNKNPIIGKIKDYAAAAVLIAAFLAVLVGLIVFIPKL